LKIKYERHRWRTAACRGAALVCIMAGSVSIGTGSAAASGSPSLSAAQLAAAYLSALGSANTAIVQAENSLKALPITASTAQVEAIVAPLKSEVSRLEALLGGPNNFHRPPLHPEKAFPYTAWACQ